MLKEIKAIVKRMEMFVGRQEKEMRAGDSPLILLDCKKEDVKRGDIMISSKRTQS